MPLVEILGPVKLAERLYLSDQGDIFLQLIAPSRMPSAWGGLEVRGSRGKLWKLPILWSAVLAKRNLPRLEVSEELETLLRDGYSLSNSSSDSLQKFSLPPSFSRLYPFQQEAVYRMLEGNLLLALSPGLGKTATTLVALEAMNAERVLIVAPKPLLYVWTTEAKRWCSQPRDLFVLSAEADIAKMVYPGWIVANYEQVVKHRKRLAELSWDVLVCDESIKVKNRHALRSQAVAEVSRSAKRRWLLSGNPISRDASDLWQQFNILFPDKFGRGTWSFWKFTESVCIVRPNVWSGGKEIVETRPDVSFRIHFSDVMHIKHQREVLSQLPDLVYEIIPVLMQGSQREAYQQMRNEFIARLETGEELSANTKMAQLTRLQQIVSHVVNIFPEYAGSDASAKADAIEEMVASRLYEFPMLVWGFFKPGMYALEKRLLDLGVRVAAITGDTANQAELFEEYKAGKLDVLILSLGVGKYGHTLTNTRTAVYMDRTFDADAYFQSLGRIQRIGLDHRPVVVILKAINTTDELVDDNLSGKLRSISQVTNADMLKLIAPLTGF